MPIVAKAKKATDTIIEALSNHELSEDEIGQISKAIQQVMVSTVEKAAQKHSEATVFCCGHEADLAHKIQEEANRKTALLISNLMALR